MSTTIKAQFYYTWGNEPCGMVSTGCYDAKEAYHFTGYMAKELAYKKLYFHCPYS